MNPFPTSSYVSPEFFCDREKEKDLLMRTVKNQGNTSLFAQRRTGKTALIHHVFYYLEKKKYNCLYIDIYATQSLKDFANHLAQGIYRRFPQNKSVGKRFLDAIKLLRPVISLDELSGSPELSLDITRPQQIEKTVPQLLRFLDSLNVNVVIAFDEFQQILDYPERNVEALLRSTIQHLRNVNFIFCGSNHRLMHQIFNQAKRPFYASTKNLNLVKINAADYAAFIRAMFEKGGRKISDNATHRILDLTFRHTYYTQELCHELYAQEIKRIDEQAVNNTLHAILQENESTYFQYRNLLTAIQWNLLKAIAREEIVERPYSNDFIKRNHLGTPAGVKRALEALVEKDLVYFESTTERSHYEINDKFLLRWMQRLQA